MFLKKRVPLDHTHLTGVLQVLPPPKDRTLSLPNLIGLGPWATSLLSLSGLLSYGRPLPVPVVRLPLLPGPLPDIGTRRLVEVPRVTLRVDVHSLEYPCSTWDVSLPSDLTPVVSFVSTTLTGPGPG